MTEQDSPTEYSAPRPKMGGFGGRGSTLTGLVSSDRTPASALTSSTSSPRQADTPAATPAEVDRPVAAPVSVDDVAHDAGESPPAAPSIPDAVESAVPAESTPPRQKAGDRPAPPTHAVSAGLPDLTVDIDDPATLVPSPTVLSVPEPIMRRFERARRTAESNTAVVLDALRAHLRDLPRLVAEARRPAAATAGEPFPWRTSKSGHAAGKVRRVQLPIRPLAGELQVIDTLVSWVQNQIGTGSRALGGRTNRSEVVVAALNAYLPAERRRSQQGKSTTDPDSSRAD